MKIEGIRFAGTATAQRAAMTRFVTEVLGLPRADLGSDSADFFLLPDGSHFAVSDPGELGKIRRTLGFAVSDLESAAAVLRAAGCEVDHEVGRNAAMTYLHFVAPDGRLYELVADTARPPLQELAWPQTTERLEVRPQRPEDLSGLWSWINSPAMTQWLPVAYPDEQAFRDRQISRDDFLVATIEGRPIAHGKLTLASGWAQAEVAELADRRDQQEAEVGWSVDPSLQGQGIGTEFAHELLRIAFDGLSLRRVVAICFAENTPSWTLMEKLGMRREATFRADSLHRSGRWLDSYSYAILAEEWREQAARLAP